MWLCTINIQKIRKFFRHLDQITCLLINFDKSEKADVFCLWFLKYIFAWFDIQGKDPTGESGCWDRE